MGEKGLEDRKPRSEQPSVDPPPDAGTTTGGEHGERTAEHSGEEIPHGGEKGRMMS